MILRELGQDGRADGDSRIKNGTPNKGVPSAASKNRLHSFGCVCARFAAVYAKVDDSVAAVEVLYLYHIQTTPSNSVNARHTVLARWK